MSKNKMGCMNKSKILALLLILTMVSIIPTVSAYHVSVTWGSRYHVTTWDPDPMWFATYEQPSQISLCSYITNLVNSGQAGPNWVAANNYGYSTRSSYVYQCSDSIQSSGSYDYLATFHIGDMYPNMEVYGHYDWQEVEIPGYGTYLAWVFVPDGTERHYAYYSSYNPGTYEGIEDNDLYAHTGAKHRFTFIYTCVNGGLIDTDNDGDYDCYGYTSQLGTGIVGMPLAWTHSASLNWDGYANPDYTGRTFIGFENTSKWTCDNREFGNHNYGDFVKKFYYYAFTNHSKNINSCLNSAMLDMTDGNYNFGGSPLYSGYWVYDSAHNIWAWCRMRVIGDGYNTLVY